VSFWILLQVLVDFILLAAAAALWIKLTRPAKDDPRLSRGLQLLQTKISVLEDLSDRTETQVTQLTALMEHKVKEIQQQILSADKQVQKIETSMAKSMEVAQIFQDRIPHQEIVERQNTVKYVKAARLAHQGFSASEIAKQVDLSQGEIEFITKVNRNHLQFSEEDLPGWARGDGEASASASAPAEETLAENPLSPQPLGKSEDKVTLSALGDRFRQAITPTPQSGMIMPQQQPLPQQQMPAQTLTPPSTPAQVLEGHNKRGETIQVRKVVFPKVET
jgi:mannose/fructose/N-acetylgalactosamine-specific phosphotransferase system component IIB